MILNIIFSLLPSFSEASPLPFDIGVALVGSQLLLWMVVQQWSCNFGFAGEDEHTYFYSAIFIIPSYNLTVPLLNIFPKKSTNSKTPSPPLC